MPARGTPLPAAEAKGPSGKWCLQRELVWEALWAYQVPDHCAVLGPEDMIPADSDSHLDLDWLHAPEGEKFTPCSVAKLQKGEEGPGLGDHPALGWGCSK